MSENKLRKVCVATGSRAEYGLLAPVMRKILENSSLKLNLVVTGSHLSLAHGETWRVIVEDGFSIDEKLDLKLSSDSALAVAEALGRAVSGFAEIFAELEPDMLMILGDRYEILAAAAGALPMKIPIAHIAGGDVTEGAFDDSIRHALTKLSHLHFVTTQKAAVRVRQMGEEPHRIIHCGSTAVDVINNMKPLSKAEVERSLQFNFRKRNLLVTFHPVTRGSIPGEQQLDELLASLDMLGMDIGMVFTGPNADPGSAVIRERILAFVEKHPNACFRESLGQTLYLSTMRICDATVGNSSSGIYETPVFKKPTVDVGDRQKGRERAASVINCKPLRNEIAAAIERAFELDCSNVANPYGDGHASERIVEHIVSISDWPALLRKRFADIPNIESLCSR